MNWIADFFIGMFLGVVSFSIETVLSITQNITEVVYTAVSKSPMAFGNGVIYSYIVNVSEIAIVPIGGIIIAFVATNELLEVIKRGNVQDLEQSWFIAWFFKILIATIIAANAFPIIAAIFEIGADIITNITGSSIGQQALQIDPKTGAETFIAALENSGIGVGDALFMMIISLLSIVGTFGMWIVAFFSIYSRFFEIYLTIAAAPIPLSTVMAQGEFNIGIRYIKTIIALSLQAFFMILIVSLYSTVISNWQFIEGTTQDVVFQGTFSLLRLMGYTVVLSLMLNRTSTLSKSIFGVA